MCLDRNLSLGLQPLTRASDHEFSFIDIQAKYVSFKPSVNVGLIGFEHYFKIIVRRGCKADTGVIHVHSSGAAVKRVWQVIYA